MIFLLGFLSGTAVAQTVVLVLQIIRKRKGRNSESIKQHKKLPEQERVTNFINTFAHSKLDREIARLAHNMEERHRPYFDGSESDFGFVNRLDDLQKEATKNLSMESKLRIYSLLRVCEDLSKK